MIITAAYAQWSSWVCRRRELNMYLLWLELWHMYKDKNAHIPFATINEISIPRSLF